MEGRDGNRLGGILWTLLATALFTVVFASGRFADGVVHGFQIVFLRYVSGLATVALVGLLGRDGPGALISPRPWPHLARALMGGLGGSCFIQGSAMLPLAHASAVGLLEGVVTVLLGILLLGERVNWVRWIGVAISLVGGVIAVSSGGDLSNLFDASPENIAVLLPLAGALLVAGENIMIRILARGTEHRLAILFHVNLFGVVILAPLAAWVWVTPDWTVVILFLCLGPLAIFAQYCNIRGFAMTEVSILGPIGYSWLVFAAALGWLAFAEVPKAGTWVGGGLIVLGGTLLALSGRRSVSQRIGPVSP
ncbi:MAG: DMT family transporter [Rhodospirillum sp.]|nr:DMT family transporter [Rhodospirillum sp.]MCF8488533.1 DMT family transporter [Rhodospirillum sp.]MCF8499278.1 DMT family transporter [Rhodospirillum sp.]